MAVWWGREVQGYDEHFDHAIGGPAERAAWERAFRLLGAGREHLAVLDVGTGTGFLALELAARGHAVTGIDLTPAMIVAARRKAAQQGAGATFAIGDAEEPPFGDGLFDLVVSRHVLWSLSDRVRAVAQWRRVLRPGGRVGVFDGDWRTGDGGTPAHQDEAAGASARGVAGLLERQGYVDVGVDLLADLAAALHERAARSGHALTHFPRYLVWGDKPR